MEPLSCARMASGGSRPRTKPHFFKPLLPGFLREFLIPIAFFTEYLGGDPDCEDQCKSAVLRTSSGKLFPVIMNGRRLEAGWPEFATEHELHVGDFVVFGHEGGLVFDVRVYDLSACQRLYPPSGDPREEVGCQSRPVVVEDDSDVEPVCTGVVVSERATKKLEGIIQPKAMATSFPSHPKHPSFSHILTRSNIEKPVLPLPSQFALENGLSKRSCEMILRDEEGRTWAVQLRHRLRNHLKPQSGHRTYISSGWRNLVIANGLKIGDHLRFELIKDGAKPAANIYVGHPSPKRMPKAEASTSAHPYFISRVEHSSLACNQFTIPMHFARANDLCKKTCTLTLQNQEGCSWPVTLRRVNRTSPVYLQSGWLKFAFDNHINAGDSIRFELIKNGQNPIMNFFVLKPAWMKLCESSHKKLHG